jgi:hypothetical protein
MHAAIQDGRGFCGLERLSSYNLGAIYQDTHFRSLSRLHIPDARRRIVPIQYQVFIFSHESLRQPAPKDVHIPYLERGAPSAYYNAVAHPWVLNSLFWHCRFHRIRDTTSRILLYRTLLYTSDSLSSFAACVIKVLAMGSTVMSAQTLVTTLLFQARHCSTKRRQAKAMFS